ncbi:hypothetical protein ACFFMN_22150 [Planobispora siamensis]|uniref:Peptidase MA superfamily protein n=1 Tax=Planobispora siamensis TaxID=936338 RepID=A0A8J3WNV7_9ACTN|nr:hypothetical protein [Planobispora siamensis]GIH96453.1 hypothetical protein Psi01_70830 [Planobispora siamensis]
MNWIKRPRAGRPGRDRPAASGTLRRGRRGWKAVPAALARRWKAVLAGLVALVAAAVAGVALAFPAVAATTCPGCYGLERLGPDLYTEADLPAGQRRRMAEVVQEADRRVRDFYGGRTSAPRILACVTEDCYRRIGGGRERGVAVLNRAVILSPRGVDPVIVSHEMSHVELHERLGSAGGRVPQWFDEGLAVVVSADPRYLLPETAADRCRVGPEGPLPATLEQWLRAAGADEQVYARSACRVHRWMAADGGKAAVAGLIERLAAGEEFTAIVGG